MTAQAGDWLDVLRKSCESSSQSKVAKRLCVSAALVNQVLKGNYKGNLKGIESRVRGEFMNRTVECPVLDVISSLDCEEHQRRPFAATNDRRVATYFACRGGCPHYRRES